MCRLHVLGAETLAAVRLVTPYTRSNAWAEPKQSNDDTPPRAPEGTHLLGWELPPHVTTNKTLMAFTPEVSRCDRMGRYYATLLELVTWFARGVDRVNFLTSLLCRRPGKSPASLRKLDKFIRGRDASEEAKQDYRRLVHFYTRELFDPFCRGHRVRLLLAHDHCSSKDLQNCPTDPGRGLVTSVAQLNFVRWAYDSGLAAACVTFFAQPRPATPADLRRCVARVVNIARRQKPDSSKAWHRFLAMAAQAGQQ